MQTIKSPGGSIFPYYYKGGEIHCLKYGSFKGDLGSLYKLMQEEESFILSRNQKLRVWVDFYETVHTAEALHMLADNLQRLDSHIFKLSIVGFTFLDKWRFKWLIRKYNYQISAPISYFDDPEQAKTWLVQLIKDI